MSNNGQTVFHSNRYHAQAACEHCEGIIRHEPWCITLDPVVYYAYQVVVDPSKLTIGDSLILHSLGAKWDANPCKGSCDMNTATRTGL
jgi:hypothetical protein